jgi:peptidoglycan/xylan/chitin deacetylase (PgdA/CDA1 family)
MKRIITVFLSFLISISGLTSFVPLETHALSGTNLVPNPSLETESTTNPNLPDSWSEGNWGTNSAAFSYSTTAHTGLRSGSITMSSYTSGDAKWYFSPQAVTAGTAYSYSDYYTSTVPTSLVAQFDDGNGNYTYQTIQSTVPASSTWAEATASFVVPSGEANVTIFHQIDAVGTLDIDDADLTSNALTTPVVSVVNPIANQTVSGTIQLAASASDDSGISQVQFQVDGANVNVGLASPYNINWNTTTVADGTHTITAIATNAEGITTTSSPVTVTVDNTPVVTAPTTNLVPNQSVETPSTTNTVLPQSWQTGGWGTNTSNFSYVKTGGENGNDSLQVQTTQYTSGDAKWYFSPVSVVAGVTYDFSDYFKSTIPTDVTAQFDDGNGNYSYVDLGTAPASAAAWQQFATSFTVPAGIKNVTIFHSLSGVGTLQTDNFSLATVDTPSVVVSSATTVSGSTVTLTATADDQASTIKSVQFMIDGVAVNTPVTASPFTTSWDSMSVANGTHTLTATAVNSVGVSTTSAPVTITVANTVDTSNMIANASVEIPDPTNATIPSGWTFGNYGTNTVTPSYLTTGGHTGSRAVSINMTSWTDGDAKWIFNNVAVKADTQYRFSDYYESTVDTEVDVAFTMSDGTTEYQILGLPDPSTTWANFSTTFTVPQGAVSMTVYHLIHSVGTLTVDDESLQTYVPTGFSSPMLTLTFDDGYNNEYTQGLPLLEKYGFVSTQFVITDLLNTSGYMTTAQLQAMSAAGNEIGSHTVTHDDMLTETPTTWTTELSQSQTTLQQLTGQSVSDFAFPNGLYNGAITAQTKLYYAAARGVEEGLNSKDNFNQYDLKVQNIYSSTTAAQVADWVAQAQATNTWLIIVNHSVRKTPNDIYNITPTLLDTELAQIKASGIAVKTMQQALAIVEPQV